MREALAECKKETEQLEKVDGKQAGATARERMRRGKPWKGKGQNVQGEREAMPVGRGREGSSREQKQAARNENKECTQ